MEIIDSVCVEDLEIGDIVVIDDHDYVVKDVDDGVDTVVVHFQGGDSFEFPANETIDIWGFTNAEEV